MQPPDQPDNKQFMREFSGSINIALILMFSISTDAQIWSRWIGSTGGWFFGPYFLAALIMKALYGTIKLTVTGMPDSIDIATVVYASLMWFSMHGIVRALRQAFGGHVHSHDPGIGVFAFAYPGLPLWMSSLLSDLTVTITLILSFHYLDCPIQRDWFAWIVLPSIVLSQAWVQARHGYLHQRYVDAAAEAHQYAGTIGRR